MVGTIKALVGSPPYEVLIVDVPPKAIGTSKHITPLPRASLLVAPLAKGAIQVGISGLLGDAGGTRDGIDGGGLS